MSANAQNSQPDDWGAIILAGGREQGALAVRMGTPYKPLARIGKESSLSHVVKATTESGFSHIRVVGPPVVIEDLSGDIAVLERGRAIANARGGISALPDSVQSLLVLPSDIPHITAQHLLDFVSFLQERIDSPVWYGTGICRTREFQKYAPGAPAKGWRSRDGHFVTGGLFACSRSGFDQAETLFDQINQNRKSPASLVLKFGLGNALKMALGLAGLADIERNIAKTFGGGQVIIHPDSHPATAFDFDTVADYEAVLKLS